MNRHEASLENMEQRLEEALEELQNWKDYAEALTDDLNSSRTTIEAMKERHEALLQLSQEQTEEIAKLRQHRSDALDTAAYWRGSAAHWRNECVKLREQQQEA